MASKKEAKKQYQHYVPAVRVVPDWYKNFNFVLITSMEELEKVFSNVETKKFYMGFDTETTGLNFEELELVGYSFCLDGKTSYYVPIYHFEYEFNLGEPAVEFIYQKMCEANKVFMYNARYDMRVFEFRGYKENKDKLKNKRFKYVKYDMSKVDYYDVAVPVWNSDTNQKMPSLKWASAHFLGFEQMHFDEVVEGAGNFFYLNPSDNFDAVYYAAADALCTYLLVPVTMKYFQEGGLATKVDNKVLYPLMHYEEEKLRLDKEKVSSMLSECQEEADRLEREVYDMLGFQINLRSPVQVAQAFQRLGIDTGEKTESGGMATGIKVLESLSDEVKEKFPALKSFVQYKETAKLLNSYFEVLQKEADRNGFLRGAYQTTNVPTGRLSAGKDAKNTYFSPMNLQALPKPHVLMYDVFDTGDRYLQDSKNNIILGYKFVPAQYDTDGNHIVPTDSSYMGLAEGMNPKLNVRSCIIPKTYEDDDVDEWVYCAADYAAQELRITANISREPVWMDAFMHGRDVHRSTAEKLWGAENYNKDLRKRAKGCFSIDSLLYTSNGAERCLSIKNGTLLGLDGGEQDFGYVVEDRDGYEIELSNGGKFEVTSDHKFLLLDSFDERWVTADSLDVGSQLGVLGLEKFGGYKTVSFDRDRKNEERSVVFDEGLAYVCGLYLGDGYLSERNFTVLVKRDNFDYVKGILERYGNTSIQGKSDESGWYVLRTYKKQFRDWVFNTFGSKKDKHINDIVYQSPKSVMLSFLAGLLDSDGKIGGCIEYSSKIRSLCCELGQLATLLGYTVISIKRNYSIYKGNRVYYYVVRLAYEDSIKEIPLMIKRSVDNINDRITSFIGYSILESERDKFKSLGKYADRGNFTDGKSVRLSRRISEKIGDWRYKYIPVSVVSIIPKKIKAFIMECESHYFIGNGLPSHNCNFGIIYGMGASSLVDPHYGIHTLADAEEFFNNYKSALPTLFQWIDRVQRGARRKGTVSTYFGRPRRLRCYYEQHNAGFANRTAVNTQIQGCHVYDNRVLTNKGYRKIGELYDEFQSINSDMNLWDYKVWNGFEWCDFFPVERGKDIKYKLTFDNNQIVECDSRHKVKVYKETSIEWVGVKDLVLEEDNVCFNRNRNDLCSTELLEEVVGDFHVSSGKYKEKIVFDREDIKVLCYIYGAILGDGHISYGNSRKEEGFRQSERAGFDIVFGLNSTKKVDFTKIKSFLNRKGIDYWERVDENHVSRSGTISPIGELVCDCYSIVDAIHKITGDLGGNVYTKRIGDKVFTLDRELVIEVLRGIYYSDGIARTGATRLANEGLVRDISLLMRYVGYDSLVFSGFNTDEDGNKSKTYWTVYPHGYESSYKNEIIGDGEYDGDYPKSTLPYHTSIAKEYSPTRQILSDSDYAVFRRVRNGGSCELRTFRRIMSRLNELDSSIYLEEDYDYHVIKSVENTGEEVQTYTLCVLNPLHQYVCEGMISKNTAGDMLKIVMCRLWNNLLDNPDYRDDVRFMITIHDEIGYAVRRSRVYEIMDLIEKNQTIVLKEWPVPIITEISAGTSVGNIFAFEKYEDPNSKTGFYYRPKLD